MASISLAGALGQVGKVWKRFYLPASTGIVAAATSVIFTHLMATRAIGSPLSDAIIALYESIFAVSMTCLFAFPLFLAIDLLAEGRKLNWILRVILEFLGLGLVVFLYFSFFKGYSEWNTHDIIRFLGLELMAVLAVLFAPRNGFWQHTVRTFLRGFLAFVFFGILFAGVVTLIFSIQYLFALDIDEKYIADAWYLITGVLVVHYFLAGVSDDFKKLESKMDYPLAVKFLAQYILVPLVIVYF
ncbi:MAG: hypothetical protein WC285_06000, partial [Candidatus Gracilibacteria bacterium]